MKRKYSEVKSIIENTEVKELLGKQPSHSLSTGYYTPSGANWSYHFQIVKHKDGYFEVVTVFGSIKGAREVYIEVV